MSKKHFLFFLHLTLLLSPLWAQTAETQEPVPPSTKSQPWPLLIGITAGTFLLDEPIAHLSRTLFSEEFYGSVSKISGQVGTLGALAATGGLYLVGNRKEKKTARLALEAAAETTGIVWGLKLLTGRKRPKQTHEEMVLKGPFSGYSSFPSGHTALAFSLATVYAGHHPKQKWLYYGLAATVGLSRIQSRSHFASDVLVGVGIGYLVGQHVLGSGGRILRWRF